MLTRPEGVPTDAQERYEAAFTVEERVGIEAALKSMFCTNLAVNTCLYLITRVPGGPSLERLSACELPAVE